MINKTLFCFLISLAFIPQIFAERNKQSLASHRFNQRFEKHHKAASMRSEKKRVKKQDKERKQTTETTQRNLNPQTSTPLAALAATTVVAATPRSATQVSLAVAGGIFAAFAHWNMEPIEDWFAILFGNDD
jgi:Flp pilus assembly protein TadB